MARSLTGGVQTESQAAVLRPFVLVEMIFDSGTTRVNSTDREIIAFGNTFLGIGRLGQVSVINESSELKPSGMQFTLTGIPSANISIALSEQYQGRPVKVWVGFLAEDTYAVVADPVLLFQGLLDQMAVNIGGTATITITAENRLVRWEQPNIRRYTNEDQQKTWSGDKGLEFVAQTAEREILWGRTGGAAAGGGTGGFPAGLKSVE